MFSGIVEQAIKVVDVKQEDTNLHITLECPFYNELKIDQSISHNGVCLTVVSITEDGKYTVTAIKETLERSNLGDLKKGDFVNVERSMKMDGRLDGHIVQGHVDTTAICTKLENLDGSWKYTFQYDIPLKLAQKGYMTVEKGSVAVNGVSLTVCESEKDSFAVNIIPYTHDNTNFFTIKEGSKVNLEFDIIGKYLARLNDFK